VTKAKARTHLVIGDSHSNPKVDNRRFDWLGNFIEDKRPDVIIDIGDWGDFDSIGKYNKGTGEAWNSTYKADLECYHDASRRAFGRIARIKGYKPRIIRIGGNHEEGRIDTFVKQNPEFKGTISVSDLRVSDFGGRYFPFRDVAFVDGIAYSHYFYEKDSRYSITSARAVMNKKHMSCTWGHSHIRDMFEAVSADKRRMLALNVGCFLDPEQQMGYAGPQGNSRWWSGLVLKQDVHNGSYDPQFFGIDYIKRHYA
jgi:hypothetical protein